MRFSLPECEYCGDECRETHDVSLTGFCSEECKAAAEADESDETPAPKPPVVFIGGITWTPKPTGRHPLQDASRGGEGQRVTSTNHGSSAAGDGRRL